MMRFKVTFKMVDHSMIPKLLECKIFNRIEIQQVHFIDHVAEYMGPSPELDTKVDVHAYSSTILMGDLVKDMTDKMVNGLWQLLEKVEVVK